MANFQYKHYALMLLTVVAVFSYIDRGILYLALEPIKAEFQLSDGQLGLMSGFSFAVFYAFAGIPIAHWADRGNRNHVVTFTTALWSAMLVFCGFAGSFLQMLLARVGIGVGEAGCVPTAQSLISDYFDRVERPKAMAVYWLCTPIASILSYILGGLLIDQFGWRYTFILIGFPGLLLAILVKITLREPRIKQHKPIVSTTEKPSPVKEIFPILWRRRTLRHIFVTLCLSTFFGQGITAWIPAFFMRSHGMDAAELGIWLGIGFGIFGGGATYLSGYLATRYACHREALQLKGLAIAIVIAAILYFLSCISDTKTMSILMLIGYAGFIMMSSPILFAAIQNLVEERIQAVTLACIFLITHLIGTGLGPVALGLASDQLAPIVGKESLRYALILFSPGFLWCALHAWKSAATIEKDIRAIENKKAELLQKAATKSEITPHHSETISTV